MSRMKEETCTAYRIASAIVIANLNAGHVDTICLNAGIKDKDAVKEIKKAMARLAEGMQQKAEHHSRENDKQRSQDVYGEKE